MRQGGRGEGSRRASYNGSLVAMLLKTRHSATAPSIMGGQLNGGLAAVPSSLLHRHNFEALAAAGRQRTAENAVGTRI